MSTNPNANKFYTFDEILPNIDADSRAVAATIGDSYAIGIEHKGEFFTLQTTADSVEADAIVIDLQRSLDEHFGVEQSIEFDEEEAQLLEGFSFVPNKGIPQLTVYTNNRLQLKGDIKTMLGIAPRTRVLIAFNPREQAFAIVKPNSKALTDDMRAAGYFVSKRKDVACAKLFREFDLDKLEGQTFYADKTSLSGNVVVFKR